MKKRAFLNTACLAVALWSGFADIASAATVSLVFDEGYQGGMYDEWNATNQFGLLIPSPIFFDKSVAANDQECGTSIWEDQFLTGSVGAEQDFRLSTSTVDVMSSHPNGHLELIICARRKNTAQDSSQVNIGLRPYVSAPAISTKSLTISSNFVNAYTVSFPAGFGVKNPPTPDFLKFKFISGSGGVSIHSVREQWVY